LELHGILKRDVKVKYCLDSNTMIKETYLSSKS